MDNDVFVILSGDCRMDLFPSFFERATLPHVKKAIKEMFRQPERNEETIEKLGELLRFETEKEKLASPWSRNKGSCGRYTKILAFFEDLKTKKG